MQQLKNRLIHSIRKTVNYFSRGCKWFCTACIGLPVRWRLDCFQSRAIVGLQRATRPLITRGRVSI